ncbi:hypothetical protein H5410_056230, partial [Solanum commersonii]
KPKNYEGGQIEDILSLILHKVKEYDRVSKEIKENVSMLNQMTASHSISIQLLDTQMGHMLSRWRAKTSVGDSPKRSANPTLSAVWTSKLTRDLVKLGEVSTHSACRGVVRQGRLTSPKGCKLNGFKRPKGFILGNGVKISTLGNLASWVELPEPLGGSPKFLFWLSLVL